MSMTDEQVLAKLREIRALSVEGDRGSDRGSPVRGPVAGAGGPRRSDGEAAQAILAIEVALSSPAVRAISADANRQIATKSP